MIGTHQRALERFVAERKAEAPLGELLGIGLPERDRILAREFPRFEEALREATERARLTGQPVAVDGSRISLTRGGDTWWVHPDGHTTREFSTFPGVAAFMAQAASPPAIDTERPVSDEVLLRCAYDAFWSPSATNWQPMRVVELAGGDRDRILAAASLPGITGPLPVLVLLRRDHYESLLGDVLEPFGLQVTAREESIDAGIFAQMLGFAALAQGHTLSETVLSEAAVPQVTEALLAVFRARVPEVRDGRDRRKLERLMAGMERGKVIPDAVVMVGQPGGEVRPYPEFDALVDQHSTQRVASPTRDVAHEVIDRLWQASLASIPAEDRDAVAFATFSAKQTTPLRIGQAMHGALYGAEGEGSMAGASTGLITAMTVRNYLATVARTDPGYVSTALGADWQAMDEEALATAAKELPVKAAHLGRYLLERLLRDGKTVVSDEGFLVDTRGKPMGVTGMVRKMKALATTFGTFFLKFQNTHPQNAVLLASKQSPHAPHRTWRTVGKVACALTYLSRAEGLSSIIKTGPIDLARDPIGAILAENPDGDPRLAPLSDALRTGNLLPAMTFQVGYPLAGSDIIDPGTPGEHDGLEERRRDKRPPREDFIDHYLTVS